ncbi:MAG: SCP2 sterol-binding domain-containing protein, partial [Gammaproteobacteria bacterium]|nr:SCP2 sterol-binding domain-containing protein [Gammaproteobacteria bacterium]
VKPEKLPGDQSVIRFHFTDLKKLNDWWLIVKNDNVDICLEDPGKDVDVYFTTDLPTMISCWMGDISYRAAITSKRLSLVGQSALTRNVQAWLPDSMFAGIRPANEI